MGRVYDVSELNGPKGQNGIQGPQHFITNTGRSIPNVVRVEFDADADKGMAQITALASGGDGLPITYRDDTGTMQRVEVSFRADIRLVSAGPK